jgi:hypothetical protein
VKAKVCPQPDRLNTGRRPTAQGEETSCHVFPFARTHSSFVTVQPDYRTFPMGTENLGKTGPATCLLVRRRTSIGAVLVVAMTKKTSSENLPEREIDRSSSTAR